uniref:starch-binding protein n=1 Tax=Ruminococcus sp. TaxID=41978 RepID=UPI00388DAFE0
IPANVTGIIFNGNNKQTVDITSGIADNVQWYTDGTQDGQYKVVAIQHEGSDPVEPTSAPVTPTEAPEQPTTAPQPGAAGYYLVGDMTNWAINGYKLTKNDGAALDEYMITATLAANDGIKVVYSEDGTTIKTWFPDGMDNDYKITTAGTYDIYFRPNYDGTEDWASGCLYVAASETPVQPTTAPVQPTEAPEQPTTAPQPSGNITIKFTDALGWGQIGVYYWNGEDDYLSDNGWPGDEMAKAEINEYGQQVYTATIPGNPDGLIFTEYYGNRQTIDITDGIVDGAQWYSIDETIDGAYNVGYVAPVQPTTAPVQPTEAPEQPTTAPQPSGNITVYFTDNADFGTPNIYYWEGGADWPGTAMTYSETNDFGQNVYKATIPANVTGIIFNGNGKQTVDITTGITDYIQWYTTDTQDGKYAVASYQRPIPAQPTEAPVQPTDPPVQPTDPPVQPTEAPQPAEGPVITTQPANWEGTDGQTATFTVAAEGDGLSYQWFYRSAGKVNWVAVAGGTTDTYAIAMSKARNGREVYVKVTDANGNSVSSDIVTMAYGVPVGPVITTQPADWYGQNGSNAVFTVVAEGNDLTYQWFYKRAGMAKFAVAQGETNSYYMVPMSAKNDGRTVFCVVTDKDGNSVNSDEATMSYPSITITQQPQNWFGQDGDQVSISVTAEGEGLSYQWFYYKAEKAKWIAAADTDAVYDSITMSPKFDNRQVYCQITNASGFSVNSDIATITYSATPITITAQPQNWYGQDGAQVSISVTAEGEGLTYQWFYWKAEKNKWIAAADTDSVYDSITMASKFAGREVFCKITDQNGNTINSDSATINYPIGG